MNKNNFAKTPPMGWNSYDYYDTTVTEDEVKKNADYMAANLKRFGWEYIVIDIDWALYDAGSKRECRQYIPFGKLEMDEYSRLLPCVERFPSAADGKGFKPLADYVHSLGLKFGIHIMRGIPRIAAHLHSAVKGTTQTADEIANAYSICPWNPDMYGVDVNQPGAQAYYDSIMELYAEWGVDFVKCDDICRYDAQSAEQEIIMLHNAIMKCGRAIVLSLSPGPALPEKAWVYQKYANMWRITDDLWDNWPHILNMFHRCEIWQDHVFEGCYPDCDMIPFGMIGRGFKEERKSRLTKEEQTTLMTLWCIFRSPLMLGADLPQLDEETLSLLTNEKVLHLLGHSHGARQVKRDDTEAVWVSCGGEEGVYYAAFFNLSDASRTICLQAQEAAYELGLESFSFSGAELEELWTGQAVAAKEGRLQMEIASHGAALIKMKFDK